MQRGLIVLKLCLTALALKSLDKRALQKSHEKSQLEKWEDKFLNRDPSFDQTASLVNLISKVALDELSGCSATILYDKFTETSSDLLLEKLFRTFPIPYLHGQITDKYHMKVPKLQTSQDTCTGYILFLKDVMRSKDVVGPQTNNKVVLVSRSSQWRVYEFLASEQSQSFMNLLVIAKSEKIVSSSIARLICLALHLKFGTALAIYAPNGGKSAVYPSVIANVPKLGFRSAESVTSVITQNGANLGIGGLYITDTRLKATDMSHIHSQDCAAFISLASTALPRYRAIMGPFHWTVWLSLTLVYLFAIFPLAFSDKHTLRHLLDKPEEVENMFWYVFGTFTNAFSFFGKDSWSKTDKFATRLLIGFYWIFTIIVTACYTGSIIAFVTLPVFPATVDTPEQLVRGKYTVGTLDKGGWQYWFENSTDPITQKLLTRIDFVPDIESGLKNTTKAFFWPYAFLGSRAQLDYIVRTNFTTMNKRSLLHISSECFVPFGVSIIYNKNALYSKIIDQGVLQAVQSGIVDKIKNDVEWETMRSASGKLLAANSYGKSLKALTVDDRALTLDDTQGMFLLLGIGFLLGGASLLSEWMGGCLHLCKGKRNQSATSIQSNYRSHEVPTPREKLDSMQFNSFENHKIEEEIVEERNCIIHRQDDDDIEEHINRLFDFEGVFGEANPDSRTGPEEELSEENGKK
nr:PREDICTED: uncharacterized protein LOC660579 [Tribolium castaneum]|eukprot:XP_015839670.1 PREDICTED: uncharacterized protein LOC660579 [Tribolium castaneum]